MTKPFFLITNDDGIHAPGIRHLWESVKDFADVAIVAPHSEKSGSGLSITWTKPLHVRSYEWENETSAWSINGTPADCIKMGLSALLERKPDLVISGINRGSNAGRTVLYSGTVGGVTEAVIKGIPGIAFSYSDTENPPLDIAKKIIPALLQYFLKHPLEEGTLLNVNFPYVKDGFKGIKMTKQGKSYWREDPDKRIHPEGAPYYWLGGTWGAFEEKEHSDISALEQGFISVTPIQVGHLTCNKTFEKHALLNEKELGVQFDEFVTE